MPELMFQQMLQLFVCCNYFKPEVAAPVAPPSPPAVAVLKASGLQQPSPGYFDEDDDCSIGGDSSSLLRSSSFGSARSGLSNLSSRSSTSSFRGSTGGGGRASQGDDDECADEHTLSATELVTQHALMEGFAAAAATQQVTSSSKTKKGEKLSKAAQKQARMKGNNASFLTFFSMFTIVAAGVEEGEDSGPPSSDEGRLDFPIFQIL